MIISPLLVLAVPPSPALNLLLRAMPSTRLFAATTSKVSWARPRKTCGTSFVGKAAGAEINSSLGALSRGHIVVSAPASKRLALSDLTLEVSALPSTTDCLHSCLLGAWTSVAMFRRPLVACFQHAYSLFPSSSIDPAMPKTVPLPRKVAQELQLVSVLAPLAASDVSVPFLASAFATDSSEYKGAFVSRAHPRGPVPCPVAVF